MTGLSILSGGEFIASNRNGNYQKEIEIINKIESDKNLKTEARFFLDEIESLYNDANEKLDEVEFNKLFQKISKWVSTTFNEKKNISNKVTHFIMTNYLWIFSTLLSLAYFYYRSEISKKSSKKILDKIQENRTQIIKGNENRDNIFSLYNLKAKTDVHLRTRQHKNARIISIVKKGQILTVLEKKVKWMRIVYEDFETNNPMTGWVYIKYFEKI